ncbi:hypothetical protein FYK55_12085 [Roseiconus nitratireducens]|uniref:Uncharacterized protein n=1 Tax=Roseiconus nitratireducens TaxID=2605748 RepID=A0A5M6DAK8_9BACT|nr:hypothetical protein [Roseiconus nitratireducens]KAA5543029.1 hypothetical protein FYK55_12085 [Roseiconus nitratireducens]
MSSDCKKLHSSSVWHPGKFPSQGLCPQPQPLEVQAGPPKSQLDRIVVSVGMSAAGSHAVVRQSL